VIGGESGQGLIPTVFGFAVVLLLLLLAVQVVFDLYARSVVTSSAVDAVRSVTDFSSSQAYDPTSATPNPSEVEAEARAVDRAEAGLGGYARATTFTWLPASAGEVELRVSFKVSGTSFSLASLPLLNSFTRTVRARVEQIVCSPGARCSLVQGAPGSGGVGGS
jgi:hypothetical protein